MEYSAWPDELLVAGSFRFLPFFHRLPLARWKDRCSHRTPHPAAAALDLPTIAPSLASHGRSSANAALKFGDGSSDAGDVVPVTRDPRRVGVDEEPLDGAGCATLQLLLLLLLLGLWPRSRGRGGGAGGRRRWTRRSMC